MSELALEAREDRGQLDRALADRVEARLTQAIAERGRAVLVVSGGSTPVGFFRELATRGLDWPRVVVTLADERWVGPQHDDSNARLLRENLLQGPAASARFEALYTGDATPEDGVTSIDGMLRTLGRFDVVILGMGGDGHTASLFPDTPTLARGLDPHSGLTCIAVHPPAAAHARMSLTLPRLRDTEDLLLHITGDSKRALIERAFVEDNAQILPIAAFLAPGSPRAAVYWAP